MATYMPFQDRCADAVFRIFKIYYIYYIWGSFVIHFAIFVDDKKPNGPS